MSQVAIAGPFAHAASRRELSGVRAAAADPSPLVRKRVIEALRALGAAEVTECASPAALRKAVRQRAPDLVVAESAWLDGELRALAQAGALTIAPLAERPAPNTLVKPFATEAFAAHVRQALRRR